MRESNFAFPPQNRASLCISSQLYDRRALDTTSPLPLFNSLSHLATLSSTSPRIREMIVMDGGLERLVRILRDFCAHPPSPEPPTQFYGLLPAASPPPAATPPSGPPIHDPKRPFDRAAAYRFSLALQCLVNIGVRGSEPIRARVVQAGTLDVVGCILEAWLSSRGFAVLPSSSASGIPRESREVRHARRLALMELRAQEHAAQRGLLPPHLQFEAMRRAAARAAATATIPAGILPSSDDMIPTTTPDSDDVVPPSITSDTDNDASAPEHSDPDITMSIPTTLSTSTSRSTSANRTDTEPESDADAEMEDSTAPAASPSHESSISQHQQPAPQVNMMEQDLQITMELLMGGVEDGPGEGGVDLLAAGRDLGMGREMALGMMQRERDRTTTTTAVQDDSSVTPRAAFASLPDTAATTATTATTPRMPLRQPAPAATPTATALNQPHIHTHHTRHDAGPYREEDVLLSLQLLAYLSKYPHVRQAFYKPRSVFNPALKIMHLGGGDSPTFSSGHTPTVTSSFFKNLARTRPRPSTSDSPHSTSTSTPSSPPTRATPSLLQSNNIFSLVERFTFRPTPSESLLSHPPPLLPPEIQHWAGVVMRNACRKDEARGGIRQCANVQCGKWESFPREFAKCRRCRKAKYCGKECQSRAWSEGHRFWCSAKEEEDPVAPGLGLGVTPARGREEDEATIRQRERHERISMLTTTTPVNVLAQPAHHYSQHGNPAPPLPPPPASVSVPAPPAPPQAAPAQPASHTHGSHPTPSPLPQYFFHAAPVPIPIPIPINTQHTTPHHQHHMHSQFIRQRVNALQPHTHAHSQMNPGSSPIPIANTTNTNTSADYTIATGFGQTARPQTYAPLQPQPAPHPSFTFYPAPIEIAHSGLHSSRNTHPYIHARRTQNSASMGAGRGEPGANADAGRGGIEPSVSTTDLPGMLRRVTDG